MVQEKLKRSSKQPRHQPETAAAAAVAAAAAARIRPGAFVPREAPAVASPAGTPHGATSSGSEGDAGVFGGGYAGYAGTGGQQSYGEEAHLQYQRQAFTPPNALATPLPARPGSAYIGAMAAVPAPSVAPTPVPGARPYTGALLMGEAVWYMHAGLLQPATLKRLGFATCVYSRLPGTAPNASRYLFQSVTGA